MSELTPITRIEDYLDAIVNSGTPPLEDITRIETFLQAIYDNTVCALTPITRIEMFLGKISGQDIVLPEPITRIELYLAAIAGEDVELPEEPITRIEMYLADWADSGDWTTISGAIVEFITQRAHKLKSCVVSLSPKQDLHGYDSPWPTGGGKNKLNPLKAYSVIGYNRPVGEALSPTASLEQWQDKGDGTYEISSLGSWRQASLISDILPLGLVKLRIANVSGGLKVSVYVCTSDYVVNRVPINRNPTTEGETISLDTTFVNDDARIVVYIAGDGTLARLKTPLIYGGNDVSDVTYSSYSNICPISGWTGCEIQRTGKNLLDKAQFEYGANTQFIWGYRGAGFLLKGGRTYTFATNTDPSSMRLVSVDESTVYAEKTATSKIVYTPAKDTLVVFRLWNSSAQNLSALTVQLELGSTATDYEPFRGNSYSVTWEDEVFGAEPDLISGEMPVTKAKYTFTWGNYLAEYAPAGNQFKRRTFQLPATLVEGAGHSITNCLGSYSTQVPTTTPYFYVSNPYAYFWLPPDTADDFTIELCGELVAPIETTITPTPITALKGYNAVWADAGPVEVTAHGTPIVEPDVQPLQAMNLLLGGAYRNNHTPDDVSDEEALNIITGGADR